MSCDVSELAQVQALADHAIQYFGRIDVWVNNAGLSGAYGPVVGLTPTDFEPVIRTNILGAYYGSWVAMRHFLTQRSGKLINILGRGERGPVPMQAAYAASKAWIKNFSLSLAKETADSGAGVYLLSPGMMDTDMLLDIQVVSGYEGHLKAMPAVLRLLSQPPEIPARKAVWLASNATDGKTGLLVREITMGKMIQFMLREVIRKITRQPGPTYDLHITTLADNFHDKD